MAWACVWDSQFTSHSNSHKAHHSSNKRRRNALKVRHQCPSYAEGTGRVDNAILQEIINFSRFLWQINYLVNCFGITEIAFSCVREMSSHSTMSAASKMRATCRDDAEDMSEVRRRIWWCKTAAGNSQRIFQSSANVGQKRWYHFPNDNTSERQSATRIYSPNKNDDNPHSLVKHQNTCS